MIGDGALTGGVAFEALQQRRRAADAARDRAQRQRDVDPPNVGALPRYFNRLRLDPTLTTLREDVERGVLRIPGIGEKAYALGKDVKESIKACSAPACSSRSSTSPTWA